MTSWLRYAFCIEVISGGRPRGGPSDDRRQRHETPGVVRTPSPWAAFCIMLLEREEERERMKSEGGRAFIGAALIAKRVMGIALME